MDTNSNYRWNRLMIINWFLLTILCSIHHVRCASVYSNKDLFSSPNFEPICNEQQERFVESEGKESSLILELHPGLTARGSCKRILSAPEAHGFIVRLIRPKIRKSFHNAHAGPPLKSLREMDEVNVNSTRSCPLSIFSSIDPTNRAWKIDPCQVEDGSDMEDPVRLFQGRLKIIWEHAGNTLASKLMVTVLGKGVVCQEANKHACLTIGSEPLLCISKDLVCDGIRHCPNSNEYDSDEDYRLCSTRKEFDANIQSAMWENWMIEIFRNLFASDTNYIDEQTTVLPINTVKPLTKVETTVVNKNVPTILKNGINNVSSVTGVGHKRNTTRLGLSSDLSKYGPWGYLMLGMLLCGGALLVCGLWECCCRNNKNDPTITASAEQNASETDASIQNANTTLEHQGPPNYEELDPPPAYSALFPNQKLNSDEATGTSSLTDSNANHSEATVSAIPQQSTTSSPDS